MSKFNSNNEKSVKVFLDGDVKRFRVSDLSDFREKLSKFAGIDFEESKGGFKWYYLDEEHDWISFGSENEWLEACECHLKPLLKIQGMRDGMKPLQKPWWNKGQRNAVAGSGNMNQVSPHQRKVENLQNRIQKLQEQKARSQENQKNKVEKLQTRIQTLQQKMKKQTENNKGAKEKLQERLNVQREKLRVQTERMKTSLLDKQQKLQDKVVKLQDKIRVTHERTKIQEDKRKMKQMKQKEKQERMREKQERMKLRKEKREKKLLEKQQRQQEQQQKQEEIATEETKAGVEEGSVVDLGVTEEEEKKLGLLESMGLNDRDSNLKILREHSGDIQKTLKVLLS